LNVTISASAALAISGPISQSGGSQALNFGGGGTLVLSGSNTFSGGTFVTGGRLIVAAPYSLLNGANLTVGNAGAFPAAVVADVATSAESLAAVVPEPGTVAVLAAAALMLLCHRARRGTLTKTAP
jgi:autotransporter-associated beta strand protein